MIRLLLIMAITFIGSGGTADGTTSAIAPMPSGNTGDILVLCVTGLTPGSPSTPTATGFSGPFGDTLNFAAADHSSDTLVSAVLIKEADGSEGANLTVICSGWTKCKAEVLRWRNPSVAWVDKEAGYAGDTVTSSVYAATLSGSGDFDPPDDMRVGDIYVNVTCLESTGYVTSGHTVVATGVTFGSSSLRDADSPPIGGTRFHTVISRHQVSSEDGSFFGGPTVQFSTSFGVAANGVTMLFRLRETQPDEFINLPADFINVGLSDSLQVSAAFTVSDTVTVGLTDEVSVLEASAVKSTLDDIDVAIADSVSVAIVTGDQLKDVEDTATVSIVESLFLITALFVTDDITVEISDSVTVDDTQVPKSVSDTATVAISDSVSIAVPEDTFTVFDTVAVALDEHLFLEALLSVSDTINVALSDAIWVFELTQDIITSDTISVGLADLVTVDVTTNPVSVSDTATVGLTDTVSLSVALSRLDIIFVALDEAIELLSESSVSDTISVGLSDAVSVVITFTPGQPMIRRFSQILPVRPFQDDGGWIA